MCVYVSNLRTPFSEKGPQAFFELDEVRAQGSVEWFVMYMYIVIIIVYS